MSNMVIQTVTISLEMADKDYGKGSGRFINLKGWYQDGGTPLYDIDNVVDDSLDMFLSAWKSLLSSKYAQGGMTGEDYKKYCETAITRTEKVRDYLRRKNENAGYDDGAQSGEPTPELPHSDTD